MLFIFVAICIAMGVACLVDGFGDDDWPPGGPG